MRILDKYIVKNFLGPFFYCLALFIFLYIIIDLFGHLDEILKRGIPVLILQEYYFSMISFIVINTAPIASLISTIYVIGALNKHDEITAMRAAGISMSRVLLPFIYIGLAISIAIFAISEKVMPLGMKNAQYIKENYIEKKGSDDDKESGRPINNIALYGKNNDLIFIESYYSGEKLAKNITILKQNKNGHVMEKVSAQEGKWSDGIWTFSDILIYRLKDDGTVAGSPLFLKNEDFIMESPEELISKGTNYEFMNFKDLSDYVKNFSGTSSPEIINRLRVDLQQKISLPFTSLVIILIGAAFAMKIKRRGKTAAIMGVGTGVVIGFVYYAVMAICIALGKGGMLPAYISAHLANVIFCFIGIILIKN